MRGARVCGGALAGPWSALVDAETRAGDGLGPGNTNGYREGGGVGSTRYTTLPPPTQLHHPGYYPSPPTRCAARKGR